MRLPTPRQYLELHTNLRSAIMPVDLPLLLRRVEQVRHVQVQAVQHICALRGALGPVGSPAFKSGADAIAAAIVAVTTDSIGANEAANHAAAEAGWRADDKGLARLRELLGEATAMRIEALSTHTDQAALLEAMVLLHTGSVLALRHSKLSSQIPRVLATLDSIRHSSEATPAPPPSDPMLVDTEGGAAAQSRSPDTCQSRSPTAVRPSLGPTLREVAGWCDTALAAAEGSLDASLLCAVWLARLQRSVRAPEKVTALLPELLRARRHARTQLANLRKQHAAEAEQAEAALRRARALAQQGPAAPPHRTIGAKVKRDATDLTAERGDGRAAMELQLDGMEVAGSASGAALDAELRAAERSAALRAWGCRLAELEAHEHLLQQEGCFRWVALGCVPEGCGQLLPELPKLLADCDDELAARLADGLAEAGGAVRPSAEPCLSSNLAERLSISATAERDSATGRPLLAPRAHEPWVECSRARLGATLRLLAGEAPPPGQPALEPALASLATTEEIQGHAALLSRGGASRGPPAVVPVGRAASQMYPQASGFVLPHRGKTAPLPGSAAGAAADEAPPARVVDREAMAAACGLAWAEPSTAPCLSCFDLEGYEDAGLADPAAAAPHAGVELRASLCDEACSVQMHQPRARGAVPTLLRAWREIARRQDAGQHGASQLVRIAAVWAQPPPPHAVGATAAAATGSGRGHVACVQASRLPLSLRALFARAADHRPHLPVTRDLAAAVCTLHAVGLCCAGRITLDYAGLDCEGWAERGWDPAALSSCPPEASSAGLLRWVGGLPSAWQAGPGPAPLGKALGVPPAPRLAPAAGPHLRAEGWDAGWDALACPPELRSVHGTAGPSANPFAADIWSLGVLFALLARGPATLPCDDPSGGGLVCAALDASEREARGHDLAELDALDGLVAAMLRSTPSQRPTCAEVVARLSTLACTAPAAASPAASPAADAQEGPGGRPSRPSSKKQTSPPQPDFDDLSASEGRPLAPASPNGPAGAALEPSTLLRQALWRHMRAGAAQPAVRWRLRTGGPAAANPPETTSDAFVTEMLGLAAELTPAQLFAPIEIEIEIEAEGSEGGEGGEGSEGGEGGASPTAPLSFERAMQLFWAAAERGGPDSSGQLPLLQLPEVPCEPNALPGLPPDLPLPPTDEAIEAYERAHDGGGGALQAQAGLGRLLLLSLARAVPFPAWLPPSTYRALLGRAEAVGASDLQAARPRTACRCALLLSSVVANSTEWLDLELPLAPPTPLPATPDVAGLAAPPTIPDPPPSAASASAAGPAPTLPPRDLLGTFPDGPQLSPSRAGGDGTAEPTKMQLGQHIASWRLLHARSRASAALTAGFGEAAAAAPGGGTAAPTGPTSPLAAAAPPSLGAALASASCAELMLCACAGRPLAARQLEASIVFQGWPSSSATPALFTAWLRECSPAARRQLSLLLTGRVHPATPVSPPPYGPAAWPDYLHEPPLVVRCWNPGPLEPRAHDAAGSSAQMSTLPPRALRAAWELMLPDYADARLLRSMLDEALRAAPEADATGRAPPAEPRAERSRSRRSGADRVRGARRERERPAAMDLLMDVH